MENKTFHGFLTKASDEGIVEAIVAVMGNVDEGKDVIHNGAFTKTISERLGKTRVLDLHKTDSIMRVLGKPLAAKELSRDELPKEMLDLYPTATGGLWTETQFLINTPEGMGAFERIKSGAVDEWSIGYDALDKDFSKMEVDGRQTTVRNLRTLKLYEYSPVLWGMNEATMTLSAKNAKGATGASDLPLGDREAAWDRAAADQRVRKWAEAEEAPNEKYRKAFFWYDAENPDLFGSYKLQFADVVDGELKAMPRGIFACAGSRGVNAADIPEADKTAIKGKINRYYARMREEFEDEGIQSPFEKAGKSVNLSEMVEDVRTTFHNLYNDQNGMWRYWVSAVYDDHVLVNYEGDEGMQYFSIGYNRDENGITFAPEAEWIEGRLEFVAAGSEPETASKAGRVLAARNAKRILEAAKLLQDALKDAGLDDMLGEGDEEGDQQPGKDGAGPDGDDKRLEPPTSDGLDALARFERLIEIELEEIKLTEV